jgi:hypothetical protein
MLAQPREDPMSDTTPAPDEPVEPADDFDTAAPPVDQPEDGDDGYIPEEA